MTTSAAADADAVAALYGQYVCEVNISSTYADDVKTNPDIAWNRYCWSPTELSPISIHATPLCSSASCRLRPRDTQRLAETGGANALVVLHCLLMARGRGRGSARRSAAAPTVTSLRFALAMG